jgi:hypothetical protein
MPLILKPRGSGICHIIGVVWLYCLFYDCTKFGHFFCQYQFSTTHTHTHTKHNTHTTTKWATTALPSSGFALSLHGQVSGTHNTWCHGSLWVRIRRAESGFLISLTAVGSFVWANEFNPQKNRVMGGGFCGRHLMMRYHNQPDSWQPR